MSASADASFEARTSLAASSSFCDSAVTDLSLHAKENKIRKQSKFLNLEPTHILIVMWL
jgi:hypothetical protein